MKGLTFRARYVPLILDGRKTTTIRRPSARLPELGDRVRLVCRYDLPPFALATVTGARDVAAVDLTDDDARADGFASADELRDALAEMGAGGPDAMPVLFSGQRVWRIIEFQLDRT